MDRGIGSWVSRHADATPQRVALVEGTTELTWAAFEERTNRLARALLGLGVRRGDRVGVLLANSVAFMEATFAIAKLGAIMVPVNTRLGAPEVGYILADAGADVLISHDVLGVVAAGCADPARCAGPSPRGGPGVVGTSGGGRGRCGGACGPGRAAGAAGVVDYEDAVQAGEARPLDMDVERRDLHGIMYTSGTTGRPKGAMLTHANALANARNSLVLGRGLRSSDLTITVAPMFHIGGLGVHSLPLVYVGGTNVIQPTFVPDDLLAAIEARRATVQFLVPAMWAAVARSPDLDRYDLSSPGAGPLRRSPLPAADHRGVRQPGRHLPGGFRDDRDRTVGLGARRRAHQVPRPGSIGRALPDVEARLVDDDDRDGPGRRGRRAGAAGREHHARVLDAAGGHRRSLAGRLVPHR